MDKYFIEKLNNLIKEYKLWQKELKQDIEKFDDETTIEQKGELHTLEIVVQDLKRLKQIYNKERK